MYKWYAYRKVGLEVGGGITLEIEYQFHRRNRILQSWPSLSSKRCEQSHIEDLVL